MNQSKKKNQKQNSQFIRNNNFLANYIDITIRGMIAFLTLGMFSYFVLIRIFNFPIWITLPIIFLLSVIVSPLLSRIQVGQRVQQKYDKFLNKLIFMRVQSQ